MNKITKGIILSVLVLGVAIIGYSAVNYNKSQSYAQQSYQSSVDYATYDTSSSGAACGMMMANSGCGQSCSMSTQVASSQMANTQVTAQVDNNFNCVAVRKSAADLIVGSQSKFSCSTSNSGCFAQQGLTAQVNTSVAPCGKVCEKNCADCDLACQQACEKQCEGACPMESADQVAVSQ